MPTLKLPRQLAGFLPLVAGALLLPAAAGAAAEKVPAKAELIAEKKALSPGVNWLAVRLTPDPGWHVYWINPGDSGQPTSLEWSLPAGATAGEIAWPAPHSFRFGALTSYGYSEEVLHLVPLTLPASAAGTAKVAVEAKWLVCAEACIPGKASLALELPVAAAAEPEARFAASFAATRAALPRQDTTQKSRFAVQDEKLLLTVEGAAKAADKAEFFPEPNDLVDHSAAQKIVFENGAWRIEQPLSPYYSESPAELRGILVLHRGRETEAWQIAARPAS